MPRLPAVKPKKIVKVLKKLEFEEIRQKGSHKFFYRKKDNKSTVIPVHTKDLGRGLLRKILNDIDISPQELLKLLHK